ncbi:type IV secretory system conjugative DNA transfer family protein [Fulvimarina sp. 2208YS6-2-32]|uniref:Type IV secretory system conjugative DNA transfer family protein n=1 Tax=Fulvimarina uroteuthidis TaxID=3098149 RepID=A0ABU5I720_9HYPH|nr:type IV secretory system conjugative DNA transfer family protein [Fulvimarina sp. 2208YS6-2-32]MDY8110920.1 type IV secretory system conjugative DNA transfer family protein [Fulvimarina sp. 2208YS6-2-32]
MGKGSVFAAVLSLGLIGAAIGVVLATIYLTLTEPALPVDADPTFILRNYASLQTARPDAFIVANLIVGVSAVAGIMVSALLAGDALTKYGRTHWQTRREMKRSGFFGPLGTGFVLGKTNSRFGQSQLITSTRFPHALLVAPTGRGKTVGFVIPNLLTFKGSAVVLDVKGENFEATARHRKAQGDEVFRFAPTDWRSGRTHRYNPLKRISEMENPHRQQMELQLLATLFLQADSDHVRGLLKGGIDIFVAAGLLAFERGVPTLGEIYKIAVSGGDKQKEYNLRAQEVKNHAAKQIFVRMASTNNDTLTSYISLLMTSGLDQWSNPAIDAATAVSDFDFRAIRKRPFSVYLVVEPLMVKPLASLIRLFFSDLIAALQENEPGKDEPWPVMIMLDEFNRLGKMPIVTDSIETLRSYRGHLAIVTQSIPALDEIYGENTRRALQSNAGVKLYLTPSDEKTIEELTKAVGTTTKRVVTKSRSIGANPFKGRSASERTEETALLTEDDARRMPLDDIVLVIDAQMPIRAKRVEYFKDRPFRQIHAAQSGEYPLSEENAEPLIEHEAQSESREDGALIEADSGDDAPTRLIRPKSRYRAKGRAPETQLSARASLGGGGSRDSAIADASDDVPRVLRVPKRKRVGIIGDSHVIEAGSSPRQLVRTLVAENEDDRVSLELATSSLQDLMNRADAEV